MYDDWRRHPAFWSVWAGYQKGMLMRRLVLVFLAIATLMMTGCSQDGSATTTGSSGAASTVLESTTLPTTTDSDSSPTTSAAVDESVDPWGLSETDIPTTQTAVTKVFLAMPDDIDGMTANRDPDTDHVAYVFYEKDVDVWTGIMWSQFGRDADEVIDSLRTVSEEEMFTIESSSLDPTEGFVWLVGTAIEPDRVVYLSWWGDPTDGSLFFVEADSLEHRTAVMEAFTAVVAD